MKRALILVLFLALPLLVSASLTTTDRTTSAPTSCPTPQNTSGQCTQSAPCNASNKKITFYVPHSSPNCATSIEGCIATSMKGLSGTCEPTTVDAVRLGKAHYASCASDSSNYGKYFSLGSVTYRSALDMKMYTVPNVICYVHDTGSAFRGRPDKVDLATTVCPTCSDAQAGVIASGGSVQVAGGGPVDVSAPGSILSVANTGLPSAPNYCMTSTNPIVVVPTYSAPTSNCYNYGQNGQPTITPSQPISQPTTNPTGSNPTTGTPTTPANTSVGTTPITSLLPTPISSVGTSSAAINLLQLLNNPSATTTDKPAPLTLSGGTVVTIQSPTDVITTIATGTYAQNSQPQYQTFSVQPPTPIIAEPAPQQPLQVQTWLTQVQVVLQNVLAFLGGFRQ